MTAEGIKAHIKELLARADEQERLAVTHQITWNEWAYRSEESEAPPEYLVFGDDEYISPFEYTLESLFESIVCYLDAKNLNAYLALFFKKFGEDFDVASAAKNFDPPNHWDGDPRNTFLSNIRRFLLPLGITGDSDYYSHMVGVMYLENILKNTAAIVNKAGGDPPTQETHVYTKVKSVIEAVFPSSKVAKSAFYKTAQEYKPDVLIPEIKVAVEYKYAKDEAKLKQAIDTIHADVAGYTNDPEYNNFYAVFYVTDDLWGKPKFEEVWREKNFPKNWKGFYIVGR